MRPELVAATDGNHGRAVAAFARRLGLRAHVVAPGTVDPQAIAAIRAEHAVVTVLDGDYDEAVRRAAADADSRPAAVLVQDTAWPGYDADPAVDRRRLRDAARRDRRAARRAR